VRSPEFRSLGCLASSCQLYGLLDTHRERKVCLTNAELAAINLARKSYDIRDVAISLSHGGADLSQFSQQHRLVRFIRSGYCHDITLLKGCLIAGLPLILAERAGHYYKSMGWSLFHEIT